MSHVDPSAPIHFLPSSASLPTSARNDVDTLKGQLRFVKLALDQERAASTIMAWLRHINVQRAEVAAVAMARERRRAAKLAKKMRKKRRRAERLSSADGDDDVSDSTSSASLSSSTSGSSSDDDSSSSSSSPDDAGDRVIRKPSANLKVEIPGARGAVMPPADSRDSSSDEQIHTRLKSPPILRPASMNSEGKWDVGSLRSPPAVGMPRRVVSFASVKVIGPGSTDRKRHRRRKKQKDKRDKADRKDKKAREKHKQASYGSPDGKSGSKHEDNSTSNDDRSGGTTQGNQSDVSPPSSPKIGGVSRVASSTKKTTNKTTNKIKEKRVNVDSASVEAATLIQRIYRRYFFMSAIRKFASTSLRIKKKSEAAYNRNRMESAVLMLQRMVRGLIAREKVRGTRDNEYM